MRSRYGAAHTNKATVSVATRMHPDEVIEMDRAAEQLNLNRSALLRLALRFGLENPEAMLQFYEDWKDGA